MTPLHWAAEKGRFNIIKPLVDKRAKINIADNDRVMGDSKLINLMYFHSKAVERGCYTSSD